MTHMYLQSQNNVTKNQVTITGLISLIMRSKSPQKIPSEFDRIVAKCTLMIKHSWFYLKPKHLVWSLWKSCLEDFSVDPSFQNPASAPVPDYVGFHIFIYCRKYVQTDILKFCC